MTASPTDCGPTGSNGCAAGTTDAGAAESLRLTGRAALRAWSFVAMRVLEDLESRDSSTTLTRKMDSLRHTHELLIRALDQEESRDVA